jgi:hypothetical protein
MDLVLDKVTHKRTFVSFTENDRAKLHPTVQNTVTAIGSWFILRIQYPHSSRHILDVK